MFLLLIIVLLKKPTYILKLHFIFSSVSPLILFLILLVYSSLSFSGSPRSPFLSLFSLSFSIFHCFTFLSLYFCIRTNSHKCILEWMNTNEIRTNDEYENVISYKSVWANYIISLLFFKLQKYLKFGGFWIHFKISRYITSQFGIHPSTLWYIKSQFRTHHITFDTSRLSFEHIT